MLPRSLLRLATPASARSFTSSTAQWNVAKLTLVGRLAADPELRTAASGREYYQYVVGCRGKTSQDPAIETPISWFNVVAFEERSYSYISKLKKGMPVYVEGDVSYSRVDKDGESKKYLNIHHRSIYGFGSMKQPEQDVDIEE